MTPMLSLFSPFDPSFPYVIIGITLVAAALRLLPTILVARGLRASSRVGQWDLPRAQDELEALRAAANAVDTSHLAMDPARSSHYERVLSICDKIELILRDKPRQRELTRVQALIAEGRRELATCAEVRGAAAPAADWPTAVPAAGHFASTTAPSDPAQRLVQLTQLHQTGTLTDDEFQAKKQEILTAL